MEHRYHPRIAIQSELLIHLCNGTYVVGAARNISNGGLAVETADYRALKKHLLVNVIVRLNGNLLILPSQVVRAGNNKVALMFIEEASPHKQVLKDYLNSPPGLHDRVEYVRSLPMTCDRRVGETITG
jgi:hypothetical protein